LWDTIDDTIKRKVNTSDASEFAKRYGCCPPQVWGVIWLIIAFIFFAAGILVGLAAFKVELLAYVRDSVCLVCLPLYLAICGTTDGE
jgi:hypothetical protein